MSHSDPARRHGIDLDAVAFNAAMAAAVEAGHGDQALQLMRGMAQMLAASVQDLGSNGWKEATRCCSMRSLPHKCQFEDSEGKPLRAQFLGAPWTMGHGFLK